MDLVINTRMVRLSGGDRIWQIYLAFLTQCKSVTDSYLHSFALSDENCAKSVTRVTISSGKAEATRLCVKSSPLTPSHRGL